MIEPLEKTSAETRVLTFCSARNCNPFAPKAPTASLPPDGEFPWELHPISCSNRLLEGAGTRANSRRVANQKGSFQYWKGSETPPYPCL